MGKIKGYQTLSGTWGEVWIDGEKIFELSKIEQKVTINREDVQVDMDIDSKATGMKGEFTLAVKKVYTRFFRILDQIKQGKDVRVQIIAKLADPDTVGGQQERYSTDNCWFNDLPLIGWEKGKLVEQEFTGGFTPSDMINLDQIKYS